MRFKAGLGAISGKERKIDTEVTPTQQFHVICTPTTMLRMTWRSWSGSGIGSEIAEFGDVEKNGHEDENGKSFCGQCSVCEATL